MTEMTDTALRMEKIHALKKTDDPKEAFNIAWRLTALITPAETSPETNRLVFAAFYNAWAAERLAKARG